MIIKNARVYDVSGTFLERDLYINGDKITETAQDNDVLDAAGCYAIPGLIDVHLHGCVGYEFPNSNVEQMNAMARYEASQGVTAICPATLTLPEEVLSETCKTAARCGGSDAAEVVGIYLEGPFISPNKLGAQNPDYVQRPDAAMFRRLQKAAGGLVKILAVAPEVDGALEMISELGDEVVCSLAHTTADYDTAIQAFSNGAKQVTHLFNAMPPFTHRAPGVIGAAADSPACRAELICDNVHIHPSAVRSAFRMFGEDRIIMISDSMMAAGLKDGEYELGGLPVKVQGRWATLVHGGNIAGSVTNLMDCVRTAVREMRIPLATAVKCASVNPARAIGVEAIRGSLTPGKIADVVLLKEDLSLEQVILRGKKI